MQVGCAIAGRAGASEGAQRFSASFGGGEDLFGSGAGADIFSNDPLADGTFFAMLYALGNMGRIWTESSHSVGRKLALTMEFMYLIVNLVVGTW